MSTQATTLTEADHFGNTTEVPASVNGHDLLIGDQLEIHGLTNGLIDQLDPMGHDESQPEPNDSRPKGNKSTFKITSVTYNKNQEDDPRRSICEEDDDSASAEESMKAEGQHEINNPSLIEKKNTDKIDSTKRFKVVKYQKLSEPYFVHRWKVTDYREPEPANRVAEISTNRGSESTSSSRASSVNFVPGVDDPSKNPLIAQNQLPTIAQSNDSTTIKQEILTTDDSSTIQPTQSNQTSIHDQVVRHVEPSSETAVIPQSNESSDPTQSAIAPNQAVPVNPSVEDSEVTRRPEELVPTEVTSVQEEDESLDENPGGSQDVKGLTEALGEIVEIPGSTDAERPDDDAAVPGGAIDNKIAQAMDLVKSHLMLAVKEEVDELKLQIKQLLEKNAQLEQENKLLRDAASPEVLAQIKALSRQTASSTNT